MMMSYIAEKLVDLTVTDKNSNCTNIILVDEETEAETITKKDITNIVIRVKSSRGFL